MQLPESDRSPVGPDHNGSPGLTAKVGVYVCHCGLNIASKVDVSQVVAFAALLPGVSVARDYKFMCADPGQELIQQDIRDGVVNRVVVASCSPLMHEATFRRATAAGGLSPFYFQMANIREDVAWVTTDGAAATEKAKTLVAAAVRRVRDHEPLERRESPVHPEVLVVGGGIAGIHAALTMAEAGKHVYLVEREATIGGHMARFDKTFPTLDCSACILTPKMSSVRAHPNITLWTYSDVESVAGFSGDFTVRVRRRPRYVNEDLCTGCLSCIDACIYKRPRTDDPWNEGLSKRRPIYMAFPQATPSVVVVDPESCVDFKTHKCPRPVRGRLRAHGDGLRPKAAHRRDQGGGHHPGHGFPHLRPSPRPGLRVRALPGRVHQHGGRAPAQRLRADRGRAGHAGRGHGPGGWRSCIASVPVTPTPTPTVPASVACTRSSWPTWSGSARGPTSPSST